MKRLRLIHPLQIKLPLLRKLIRLDEHEPRAGRQVRREVRRSEAVGSKSVIVVDVKRGQTPLRRHIKPPNRLDLIAKELNANRILSIRREDIQNAAAQRKLARQLDRRRRMPAALQQATASTPAHQLRPPTRISRVAAAIASRDGTGCSKL